MSWSSFHKQSEDLASKAHEAMRQGRYAAAIELFRDAAIAEESALEALDPSKVRTLGITAVSAVALWYKGGELSEAERLAHRCFGFRELPNFATEQLRSLLQAIWNERAQRAAGISFVPGQVIVSVRGGTIVKGGAPLDLIVDKVQAVQSLFYRTAELIQGKALRRKGPPAKELQERCKPWLFQSVPASYQFAVAIQKPAQGDMFPENEIPPEVLTRTFLSILKATGEDPEDKLRSLVPDDGYRNTFLKLTRNLTPTGKSYSEIEINSTVPQEKVIFLPSSRKAITETLRKAIPKNENGSEEVTLRGVLRAVHLDQDWLELSIAADKVSVHGVGESVDDLIGPMVNHDVIVRAFRDKKEKYKFIDIEQDE
jgi:hypothetical protein